ncbi:TolB-like translocation protein [Winogradskyella thalassocola]|uniref:WD40-like Beta Propeller Repeat n=1 Tax=Winogradskyella thalassocola TaxID=262004 RepID=A0A1G8LZR7_9FLAO|nr:PD40 domain-containing protein [Winogradskyella thalassocola]SDI60640.1 WD40-like Beta Propeller Repeat [Winogradskyella thalassocola]
MIKNRLIIAFVLISNIVLAQHENDIRQFDKTLNQFLNVRDFCISKSGDEVFFTIQSPGQEISQLASMKKEDNEWTAPKLLSFCDSNMYLEPFLSVNGNRLFFASDRPLNDSINVKKNFDIWYVDRDTKDSEWSQPKNIGKPINSDLNEFYPTLSENNNLYFTLESPNGLGKDDIYFSKWENDKYSNPIVLDENINSEGYEFNAFISSNEDFMIFSKYNEKDGQGSGDLYISKKDANGKWKKATNLGTPINTQKMEYCPFYDEKNQILYFTSKRSNIYSRNFKNISDFKNYVRENNNGLSKIYMVPLKIK